MVTIKRVSETDRTEYTTDFDVAQMGTGGLEGMSLQHFRFLPGSKVETHHHPQEQIGYVFTGELTLTVDETEYVLGPDDIYYLQSNEPHSGENRGDEPVLGVDIFSPPRDAPQWAE